MPYGVKKKKQTVLWELRHPAQTQPSWLLGTMHVRDNRAFRLEKRVRELLERCTAFAAEYHLEAGARLFDPRAFSLPEGKRLQDFIPPRKYQKLRRILLKAFQLDLDLYNRTLPIFIVHELSNRVLKEDRAWPLDEFLWNLARSLGKEMLGIETPEEQLEILSKVPLEYQLRELLHIGRHVKKFRHNLHHLAEVYVEGDLARLHKMARKSAGALRKTLLLERNYIMSRRIERLIAERSVFIAVGVGHLSGGKGILRLLKKKGVQVRPVPMNLAEPPTTPP